ncbi:MAG TPA: hypothetical protein VFC34_02755 [Puia sp.]|nr:hypothetical protein [Puia sp.]
MVRCFSLLLFLFLANIGVRAQSPGFLFTLEGSLNSDTGTVQLFPMGNALYYAYHPESIRAPVVRGKFVFKDSVLYPSAYRIFFFRGNELTYLSDFFLVDSGYQTIRCNIDSLREMPILTNFSRREFANYYDHVLATLNLASWKLSEEENRLSSQYGKNLPDSLRIRDSNEYELLFYNKSKMLLNYAKEHPSSYVALWDLIHRLHSGYKAMYDSVYAQFSDDI